MKLKEVKIYWHNNDSGKLAWHYFEDDKGVRQGIETTYHEDGRLFYTHLRKDGKSYGPIEQYSRDKSSHRFFKNNIGINNNFGQQKFLL